MAEQYDGVIKQFHLVPCLLNVMSDPDSNTAVIVTTFPRVGYNRLELNKIRMILSSRSFNKASQCCAAVEPSSPAKIKSQSSGGLCFTILLNCTLLLSSINTRPFP